MRWPGELTAQLAVIALVFQALLVSFGHGTGAHAASLQLIEPSEFVICTSDRPGAPPAARADQTAPEPKAASHCPCAALCRDAGSAAALAVLPSDRAMWLLSRETSVPGEPTIGADSLSRHARGLRPEVRGPPAFSV